MDPREYMDGSLPIDVQAKIEAARRRSEEEFAAKQERAKRDKKAREEAERKQAAEDAKKSEEMIAANRAIAKEQLDAKLAKIERDYLNAGGDPKKWPAFRDIKAAEILANQLSERERKAQRDAIDVIRGNLNITRSEGFKPFDI